MKSGERKLDPHGEDDESHEPRHRILHESAALSLAGETRGKQYDQPRRRGRHADERESRRWEVRSPVSSRDRNDARNGPRAGGE